MTTEPRALPADPSERVRAHFAHVGANAMRDMPLCNPALDVATVGFFRHGQAWVGVLVTPWCMNLMLLPDADCACERQVGETQWWTFPSGEYPFIAHRCDSLGDYQACSLYSPVFEFDSQAYALDVARETLRALMVGGDPEAEAARQREAARLEGRSVAELPVSRRGFLRAVLPGGER
ncbi:MAG: [NiFe]-hydrogenase assembly chaperone HybE [Rhodocyclaceae bacterium]|nr:[NiFe]-hydrogenase assembly chaperone HybE [Rhodocyclaceae bacterium]